MQDLQNNNLPRDRDELCTVYDEVGEVSTER